MLDAVALCGGFRRSRLALDGAFDHFFRQQHMNTFDTHTAPGQSVHATEVDYLYDTHAVRTADYNAIRWEIRNLQKSLRERDSERFNVEADTTGAGSSHGVDTPAPSLKAYERPRTHQGANANVGDFHYWDRASTVLAAMVQLSLFSAEFTSESGTSVLDRLYRRAFLPTSDNSGAITKKYLS